MSMRKSASSLRGEVEVGELPEKLPRFLIVPPSGSDSLICGEASKVDLYPMMRNGCPDLPARKNRYAYIASFVGFLPAAIMNILAPCRYAKILVSIIKTVMVDVVALPWIAMHESEELPVHLNDVPLAIYFDSSHGVESAGTPISVGKPPEPNHIVDATPANLREFSLSERDENIICKWGRHLRSYASVRFGCYNSRRLHYILPTTIVLLISPILFAQTGVVQGHCYLGGQKVITSGTNSSNYANGIVPACLVTVYLTGTTTKQTITTTAGGALANPFTANAASAVDPGGWAFRAATNVGLDVVMSGGGGVPSCTTAPNCYTTPVTLTDVYPSQSFSPVGGVISAEGTAPITVNGTSGMPETGAVTIDCTTAASGTKGCPIPDGTATHYLDGTGGWTVPSGGAGDCSATDPACVQYNASDAVIAFAGDSRLGDDTHIQSTAITVTAISSDGTHFIFTNSGTNGLAAGDWIDIQGITSPAALNVGNTITTYNVSSTLASLFQVISAGLSTTQFEIDFPSSTGTCASACGTAYTANNYVPFQVMRQPFFSGHGTPYVRTAISSALAGSTYTTYFHPISPVVTSKTGWLIFASDEDVFSGATCTLATIEGYYSTWWASAHTDGWKVVTATTPVGSQNTSIGFCTNATYFWQAVNEFIRASRCTGSTTSACTDAVVDLEVAIGPNATSSAYQNNGRYYAPGSSVVAGYLNQAMSAQKDKLESPMLHGNGYGFDIVAKVANASTFRIFSPTGWTTQSPDFSFDTNGHRAKWTYGNFVSTAAGSSTDGDVFNLNNTDLEARIGGVTYNLTHPASSGISGMTTGELGVAGSATTITSSKPMAGAGAGVTTGPVSGTTADDLATMNGTDGRIKDSGVLSTNLVNIVTPTSPIVASITGHTLSVSCPTCGTSSGGTNVSQNSGSTETNLPVTGFMPQFCSDTSGSGTAQSCTVANTFVPQTGNTIVYTTTTTNSGTGLTINVNSLGAKSVAVPGASGWTTTLTASAIPANKPLILSYDGTNWNVQQTGTTSAAAASAPYVADWVGVVNVAGSVASITSAARTINVGDLIVVWCRSGAAITSDITTSSVANTWTTTAVYNSSTNNYATANWSVIGSGGSSTFTCTPNTSTVGQSMTVMIMRGASTATLNGSAGSSSTSSLSFLAQNLAITTSGRSLNVLCAATISTSNIFFGPAYINGIPAQVGASANATSLATNDEASCAMGLDPLTRASVTALMQYGIPVSGWAQEVVSFSY